LRTKFFRTRYLTGSRMQMRYLGLLLVSMMLPLFIIGGLLYYLMFNIMAEQIGVPEYIAINLFPVINKINTILVFGMPPILFVIILWGIALSHRFAGPLERLEKELGSITKNRDYGRRIKLRKNDDLLLIAESINTMLNEVGKERR